MTRHKADGTYERAHEAETFTETAELTALRRVLDVCNAVLSVPRVPTETETERAELEALFYGTREEWE